MVVRGRGKRYAGEWPKVGPEEPAMQIPPQGWKFMPADIAETTKSDGGDVFFRLRGEAAWRRW